MKPRNMLLDSALNESFIIKRCDNEDLNKEAKGHISLHIHKDFELMAMINGRGNRIIGNSIEPFHSGELVLIGSNVPHEVVVETSKKSKNKNSEYIYLCFDYNAFGENFFNLPELHDIRILLNRASSGIAFGKQTSLKGISDLKEIVVSENSKKVFLFFNLLSFLAGEKNYKLLNNNTNYHSEDKSIDRINKVYSYVMANYHEDITIKKISSHVGLTPSAFSRYFKAKTYKNFIDILNEIRISNAARILVEEDISVSDVAYSCGFNSISSFNRQFKKYTNLSPLEYKKKILQ